MHIAVSEDFQRTAIYRQDFLEIRWERSGAARRWSRSAANWPDGRARRSLLTRRSPPPDVGEAGAIHFRFTEIVSSKNHRKSKIFRFIRSSTRAISGASRPDQRGARERHERGTGSDGRGSALDERHGGVRQRRVVLTSHGWRLRWQQYKARRGDHVISRKPIAQGMPDVLRCPVCSCAHSLPTLRMRPRVQRASGIPCALWIERAGSSFIARAQCVARIILVVPDK